jgi:hypothetical protein
VKIHTDKSGKYFSVVRQNISRDTRTLEGRTRARGPHIYIRTGGQSVRTRPLDRNVGAARRVAHGKGPDPKIRNESSGQVSPSQVRDACGPHGNEPTPKAIARNFVTCCWRIIILPMIPQGSPSR